MRYAGGLLMMALVGSHSGCGSGNPGSDAVTKVYAGICQLNARCGVIGASEVSGCLTNASAPELGAYTANEAVNAGRIGIDSTALDKCLSALQGNCDQALFAIVQCASEVFVPKVPLGGLCKSAFECMNGQCTAKTSGCSGTCVAYAQLGADCDDLTMRCAPTAACDLQAHKCVAPAALGSACTGYCQSGSACRPGPGGMAFTCQAMPGPGQACVALDCPTGYSCKAMICVAEIPVGAACMQSDTCVSGSTCAGRPLNGGGSGTCTVFLDVGGACDPQLTTACPDDMICDFSTRKCALSSSGTLVGGPCDMFQGCGTDIATGRLLYCDTATMKCANAGYAGDACSPANTRSCHEGMCDAMTRLCTLACS